MRADRQEQGAGRPLTYRVRQVAELLNVAFEQAGNNGRALFDEPPDLVGALSA